MALVQGDQRPECCRQTEQVHVTDVKVTPDGKLIVRCCQTCGRRHFEAHAKPKVIGIATKAP